MSDPFNILGDAFEPEAVPWEQAYRDAVGKLQSTLTRFEALAEQIPEQKFSDEEWRLVEKAAEEVEEAVERAEEGYVAVQYDPAAWYRIMESLDRVHLRLESAIGLMERVRERS